MSVENVISFFKKVNEDQALQAKMKALPDDRDKAIEEGIKIAKAEGFDITKADYEQFETEQEKLSDEDLDKVAGGDCYVYVNPCMKKH